METGIDATIVDVVSNYRPTKTLTRHDVPDDLSPAEFEILIGILMETVSELAIGDQHRNDFDLLLLDYVEDRINQALFLKSLLSLARKADLIDDEVELFLVSRVGLEHEHL
jgi:hypothetical protein